MSAFRIDDEGQDVPVAFAPVMDFVDHLSDKKYAETADVPVPDVRTELRLRDGGYVEWDAHILDLDHKLSVIVHFTSQRHVSCLSRIGVVENIDHRLFDGELDLPDLFPREVVT